jgi:hypothetical protein
MEWILSEGCDWRRIQSIIQSTRRSKDIFRSTQSATPWKDVDLKNVAAVEREPDSQQLVLGILNDLGVNHNEINPENRVAVPFTVLADWLEAAVNVADFSL